MVKADFWPLKETSSVSSLVVSFQLSHLKVDEWAVNFSTDRLGLVPVCVCVTWESCSPPTLKEHFRLLSMQTIKYDTNNEALKAWFVSSGVVRSLAMLGMTLEQSPQSPTLHENRTNRKPGNRWWPLRSKHNNCSSRNKEPPWYLCCGCTIYS